MSDLMIVFWLALSAIALTFWPRYPDKMTVRATCLLLGLMAVAVWAAWPR